MLVIFHRFLSLLQCLIAGCLETAVAGACADFDLAAIEENLVHAAVSVVVQTGEDDDRELQPFGGMHRHYAHGVLVRLWHGRLRNARALFCLPLHPVEESA